MNHESQSGPFAPTLLADRFNSKRGEARLPFLLPLVLCVASIQSQLFAETLIIDRQITGIVHHYSPPNTPVPGYPGYVNDEILFDTTGLTGVNLSQYTTFKLRLFAPADQKVAVNHSDSTYRSGVSVYYQSAGSDSSSHTEPASLAFENFTGTLPTRDYSLFYIGDLGNVLKFQAQEVYTADGNEFTAMSYTFTAAYNPANTAKNFSQQSSSSIPVSFSYQTSSAIDPGPFVSLVPITPPPPLIIDRQITGIVHHYSPPDVGFPTFPGYVHDEILFDTAGLTGVDLSRYTIFKLRLFAPAGQKVTVSHSGNYSSGLSIFYRSDGDSSSHTEPAKLTFQEFAGIMPARNYSLFYIGDLGNVLEFQAQEDFPAGSSEFTAMSYTFSAAYNPGNTAKDFTQRSSSGYPVSFGYQTSSTTDPGPFVAMAPTPPLTATISADSGQVFIEWLSKPNQHYRVGATTQLTNPASWADISTTIIGDGGLKSVSDPIGATPSKFYRVQTLSQSSPPTP